MSRVVVVEPRGPGERRALQALVYLATGQSGSGGASLELLAYRDGRLCGVLLATLSPAYLRPVEERAGVRLAHLRGYHALCREAEAECLGALARGALERLAQRGYDAMVTLWRPEGLEEFFREETVGGKRYWVAWAWPRPLEEARARGQR